MIPCRLVAFFDDGDLCAERAGYRHCIYLVLLGKTYGVVKKIHKTGFMVFNVIYGNTDL